MHVQGVGIVRILDQLDDPLIETRDEFLSEALEDVCRESEGFSGHESNQGHFTERPNGQVPAANPLVEPLSRVGRIEQADQGDGRRRASRPLGLSTMR